MYSKKWIAVGTKVEMEHTTNRAMARKIALDHFKEFGNAYYPALLAMEHKLALQQRRKK